VDKFTGSGGAFRTGWMGRGKSHISSWKFIKNRGVICVVQSHQSKKSALPFNKNVIQNRKKAG
jgi:hypothetical protein